MSSSCLKISGGITKREDMKTWLRFPVVYGVFVLFALAVNLSMEMLIPVPEAKDPLGIIMFYLIFSAPGSVIFLVKNYRPVRMGLLSAVLGMIFEFTFMRPDWVINFNIGGAAVSTVYWFIAWGVPSYFLHRFITKRWVRD